MKTLANFETFRSFVSDGKMYLTNGHWLISGPDVQNPFPREAKNSDAILNTFNLLVDLDPIQAGAVSKDVFWEWIHRSPIWDFAVDPSDQKDYQEILGECFNRTYLRAIIEHLPVDNVRHVFVERKYNAGSVCIFRLGEYTVALMGMRPGTPMGTDPLPVELEDVNAKLAFENNAIVNVLPAREREVLQCAQYVLDRIQRSADLWHHFELTESFDKLCQIESTLTGKRFAVVKGNRIVSKRNGAKPQIVELEEKIRTLKSRLRNIAYAFTEGDPMPVDESEEAAE